MLLTAFCFAIICAKSPKPNKTQKNKLVLRKVAVLKEKASKEQDDKKKKELEARSKALAKTITG